MDEAATYRAFVAPVQANHWAPHSNNHILNSLLMRLTTTAFGLSPFTVRLPALAGASVYVVSCFLLSRVVIAQTRLRLIVFACLILNPYLSDFYVTARGYSLAFGFLTAAITVIARLQFRVQDSDPAATARTWMAASALLGLSFAANFPFAFIDAASWAALMMWTLASKPRAALPRPSSLLAASVLPGALAVLLLASWTLLNWPKGQLWDGAHSLRETFHSVIAASLFQPNPEIVNPLIESIANRVRPLLIPFLCAAAVWHAGFLLKRGRALPQDLRTRRTVEFALVAAGALSAALLIHWIAFHCFNLLLPRNRFATYLVPFWTLTLGALAAIPASNASRRVLISLLCVLALYYTACIRSGYFYEWWSNADTKEAYCVLAYYNHNYHALEAASRFPLTDCLEFYRRASGRETLTEFTEPASSIPYGKDLYALYESQDRELIARQNLKIVYRGRVDSDLVVAIRPGLERVSDTEEVCRNPSPGFAAR